MQTQKIAKKKVTTALPARVLSATGDALDHRRLGEEIGTAFAERDALRIENAALKEQIATMQAAHGEALATRDRWIENVCLILNLFQQGQEVSWFLPPMTPPTDPESPGLKNLAIAI